MRNIFPKITFLGNLIPRINFKAMKQTHPRRWEMLNIVNNWLRAYQKWQVAHLFIFLTNILLYDKIHVDTILLKCVQIFRTCHASTPDMAKIHSTLPCVVVYILHTHITCISRIHDFWSCFENRTGLAGTTVNRRGDRFFELTCLKLFF